MIYNISNEPNYGFKRKVEILKIIINVSDLVSKFVSLLSIVKYYDNNDLPVNIIPFKEISLVADNTTWVDVDGNIVPEGDIAAVMTEYEFFMAMMDVPVVISDIVESKVAWADSLGRFN